LTCSEISIGESERESWRAVDEEGSHALDLTLNLSTAVYAPVNQQQSHTYYISLIHQQSPYLLIPTLLSDPKLRDVAGGGVGACSICHRSILRRLVRWVLSQSYYIYK
ncbi:unnamed protein product, partial [Ectocarpus sp. 8 AP-2014]